MALYRGIKDRADADDPDLQSDISNAVERLLEIDRSPSHLGEAPDTAFAVARLLTRCFGVAFYYSHSVRDACLDKVLNGLPKASARLKELLTYEMVFVESALGTAQTDLRERIYAAINEAIRSQPTIGDMAAVRDYLISFGMRNEYRDWVDPLASRHSGQTLPIQVVSLHSIKGGVGKTLLTHAMCHRIASGGVGVTHAQHEPKVVLLDIDYSGPSAQYILSLKELNRFCREFAGTGEMYGLKYPNFWTAFQTECGEDAKDAERTKKWEDRVQKLRDGAQRVFEDDVFSELCYEAEGQQNLEVILTIHDTVELPEFQSYFASTGRQARLAIFLDELITYLVDSRGVTHLVVDSGPGLYGVQGLIMQYLSTRGMRPIVMSSNRVYDVFSTAYEMAWFLSREEFPTTPLWVINMFQPGSCEHPLQSMTSYGVAESRRPERTALQLLRDAWTYGRYLLPDERDTSDPPNIHRYASGRLTVATMRWNSALADIVNLYRGAGVPQWQELFAGFTAKGHGDCWLTDLDGLITQLFSN